MAPATGFEPATCPLTAVTFLSPARPGQTSKLKSGAGMASHKRLLYPLSYGPPRWWTQPDSNRRPDNASTPARTGNSELCRRSKAKGSFPADLLGASASPETRLRTPREGQAGQAYCVQRHIQRAPLPAAFRHLKVTFKLRPARPKRMRRGHVVPKDGEHLAMPAGLRARPLAWEDNPQAPARAGIPSPSTVRPRHPGTAKAGIWDRPERRRLIRSRINAEAFSGTRWRGHAIVQRQTPVLYRLSYRPCSLAGLKPATPGVAITFELRPAPENPVSPGRVVAYAVLAF